MKPMLIALGLAGLITAGVAITAAQAAVEEPDYTRVTLAETSAGEIEIRDYPSLVIAETVTQGDREEASGPGFRTLAGYIFESERPEGKIAMTAPVLMQPAEGERTAMRFIMPKEWSLDRLPRPENSTVALREINARRLAAIRFSGWADDRDLAEKEQTLRAYLAQEGLEPIGDAIWAFYNPPWTLGPWRRNEVLLEIAQ